VIVVNKWDVAEEEGLTPEDYSKYLLQQLRGLDYAPIVFISAKENDGLHDLLEVAPTKSASRIITRRRSGGGSSIQSGRRANKSCWFPPLVLCRNRR
jgi:predicted GTPase